MVKKLSKTVMWSGIAIVTLPAVLYVMFNDSFSFGMTAGKREKLTIGMQLYSDNCASCHGVTLQGTRQGPPFIHKIYEPSHHGDKSFYLAVENGSRAHHWSFGDMPAIPGLGQDDVSAIIEHIRYEQRKKGIK
ncbi:c-type cytochrome [Zobellella iuensis]|uniref:Cytochrome c n=1 Tax=Zobellella iuensis TaxID=2803811 RepID=A0ABS1QXD0_9GAMM|nr:cytochrome c [Zobellella iuensis]MBL1378899.1 cytochrome c [Zobellella iuensis]